MQSLFHVRYWRIALFLLLIPGCAPRAFGFGFSDVVHKARSLSGQPYQTPAGIPKTLTDLTYDQYKKIRFHSDNSLWRESHTNFQVVLIAPGLRYRHPVTINVVDAAGVHQVSFDKSLFKWPSHQLRSEVPADLGYAGFKLTYPLNHPGGHDQVLVFAGSSYFRAVARGERFGLSARGIAVDTGLSSGEKFPSFTRFWLVRPSPDSHAMKFYALLNGSGLTGAYRFVVFPGKPTRIEVHARLFLRKDIKLLGLAPLTSMFLYGSNSPRPDGNWRPAAHDSGGLLIHSGSGEWLWRPLIDPLALKMDYFHTYSPRGFGLMQRRTGFDAYEDAGKRYDKRPSAWIEPHGNWDNGHVVLVQIPSDAEVNDNIVAFWAPSEKAGKGDEYTLNYTMRFGGPKVANEPMGRATKTFVGTEKAPSDSNAGQAYRFVIDFSGGSLQDMPDHSQLRAVVSGLKGTQVLQQSVQHIAANGDWRLSLVAVPDQGKPVSLRAYLKAGKKTLSETWTYSLPAKNRFNGG